MGAAKLIYGWYPVGAEWIPILVDATGKLQVAGVSRFGYAEFWSLPALAITVVNVAADRVLPDVVVAGLPAGSTVIRATALFRFRAIINTGGANKLSGAQEIQVRDDSPSAWVDAINFVDDMFPLLANTREVGGIFEGAIDVKATVDGDDTYNLKWELALADAANLVFRDFQMGLRIYFTF